MDRRKKSCVLAIGIFDGVHLGHRAILKKALSEAKRLEVDPGVLTFTSHPSCVLRPSNPVKLLQTFEERSQAIRALGIKWIFSLHFTERLSRFSPSEFVDKVLFRQWNVRGVVVGKDFRFGRNRSGGVGDLRNLLAARGARVWSVDAVRLGSRVVQSTAIREYISSGRVDRAQKMLGRVVALSGRVERGSGLGRKLAVRTLNLRLRNQLLPKFGVYAGWLLERKPGCSVKRPVVMNLGVAPTIHKNRRELLEVHVLDEYPVSRRVGALVQVELGKFLRPERKFSSTGELRFAIQQDIRRACRHAKIFTGTVPKSNGLRSGKR